MTEAERIIESLRDYNREFPLHRWFYRPNEDRTLRAFAPLGADQVARKLGRSTHSVHYRAAILGIHFPHLQNRKTTKMLYALRERIYERD